MTSASWFAADAQLGLNASPAGWHKCSLTSQTMPLEGLLERNRRSITFYFFVHRSQRSLCRRVREA
jgi:hypothetical protein